MGPQRGIPLHQISVTNSHPLTLEPQALSKDPPESLFCNPQSEARRNEDNGRRKGREMRASSGGYELKRRKLNGLLS